MKIIAYYRVSTKRQGISGLGLEGQQFEVAQFARRHDATIIASYKEVESGKRSDRPELAKALAHAKRSKAKLVVAKLDRLSRNVAFLSALMESKADFVACDNEHANPLTLHVLAAVAEAEAKATSLRTKAALQAAKRRGTKLGSARAGHWTGRENARLRGAREGGKAAAVSHHNAAAAAYSDLYEPLAALRSKGLSLSEIAAELNQQGHTTRRGCPWNHVQVLRVLRRVVA